MEKQWVLVAHGLLTLLVVVSFLCGQWPIFQGTIIERIHNFITFGLYDYFLYTSFLAVGVGILLFLLTSFSDPGTVKAENASKYLSTYPYDNSLALAKQLNKGGLVHWNLEAPPRMLLRVCLWCGKAPPCYASCQLRCASLRPCISLPKVSSSTQQVFRSNEGIPFTYIAKSLSLHFRYGMDSPQPWAHSMISEQPPMNLMVCGCWTPKLGGWLKLCLLYVYLVPFPRHFFLCLYGAIALGLVLAGEIKERQWLLGSYNTHILLMVFLAIVSLLLAGFFGYHAHLCLTNTTTNETFKWEDYVRWKRKLNEAKASSAALKSGPSAINGEQMPKESKWRMFFRRSPRENEEVVVKDNIYDRGVFHNLYEILCPLSGRWSSLDEKSDGGSLLKALVMSDAPDGGAKYLVSIAKIAKN
ncbi:hypothetical protein ACLOJK_018080 [Asimina triloba]